MIKFIKNHTEAYMRKNALLALMLLFCILLGSCGGGVAVTTEPVADEPTADVTEATTDITTEVVTEPVTEEILFGSA